MADKSRQMLANRYELIRKIGSGGMALVYQAYDTSLDRQVAIKFLREEFVDDPDFNRQFQKEAKAIARLSHQNIVNIYDYGNSDGVTYLVMEYVEGSTLKDIIAQYGALPISQVIDYSIQVCYGMAQAHNQQIVHKDIKPHNIMVDRNHVVKITDFGIAQAMNNLTITHNKGILGSAHYFSPEQARGDRVDFESDIYSLGIVMYEMISGKVPFTGDNPVSVALKHMQEKPASLTAQRDDVPPELERIVFRALEKKPNHRFASMQEMADALITLQLHLEERGYYPQNDAVVVHDTGRSKSHRSEKNTPERERKGLFIEEVKDPNNDTRVMDAVQLEEERNPHRNNGTGGGKRRSRGPVLIIAALLLFVVAFFGAQFLTGGGSNGEIAVPNLENYTLEEAEKLLNDMDLKLKVEDEIFDDTIEEGHIISQTPSADSNVKKGREIAVVISKGIGDNEIPNLIGLTQEEAQEALESRGFKLGLVMEQENGEYPEGTIFYQSIREHETAKEGTAVDINISKVTEEKLAAVPNLVGKTQDEAKKALTDAKLQVGNIATTNDNNVPNGQVISQQSAAGTSVPEGTAVAFTVSLGPAQLPQKSAEFELIVPETGKLVVQLTDNDGSSKLLERDCVAGERVQQAFMYRGDATVSFQVNGREVDTRRYGY